MASNPFDQFDQPRRQAPLASPPKTQDPYQVQKDQTNQQNEQARLAMERERLRLSQSADMRAAEDQQRQNLGSESERTAAFLATRVADEIKTMSSIGDSGNPTLATEAASLFGRLGNYATPEARQRALGAQLNLLDAALTLGTGAAYNREQLLGYTKSYFPEIGDSPATLKDKRHRLDVLLAAARIKAGAASGQIDAALSEAGFGPAENRDRVGNPVFADQAPPENGAYRMSPQNETIYRSFVESQRGNPNISLDSINRFLQSINERPLDANPENQRFIDELRNGNVDTRAVDYNQSDRAYQDRINQEIERGKSYPGASAGLGDLLVQGGTFGLSDEALGLATATLNGITGQGPQGYALNRDIYRAELDQVRADNPNLSLPTEIGGALLTGNPNALLTSLPTGVRELAAQGAKYGASTGAAAGFGYGEGGQQSVTNALLGAGTGAVIGGSLALAGPAINAVRGRLPARAQPDLGVTLESGAPATGSDVAAAGQAEGVTVNRAMVDPASRNRVIGVEKSQAGGEKIRSGMKDVSRQIEGRINDLGRGGAKLEPEIAGATVRATAEKIIKTTGKAIGRQYDKAVELSNDVKIKPTQANQTLDDTITRLSQTPETNSAEIAYLQGLKNDLSKPLGVEALRDLRTTLRKKISKGDLVFGQNEGRVLGVMDSLSRDIESGLKAAGKSNAASLFRSADNAYRERADFIDGTIQKLIGKRNANLPPETVFKNFQAMATPKGNEAGLSRMIQAMDPTERADIAATFAQALGRNTNNEFSPAIFISQAEKLPKAARRHLFGDEGAKSIENLVLLSKAHKAVPMGGSPTGAASSYRAWLTEVALGSFSGLTTGLATGSAGTGAATALAAGVGAKVAGGVRDIFSARALMSPKITNWIRTAPATRNPAAINAHFQKLAAIAAQEPALSGEIQTISNRLLEAAKSGFLLPSSSQNKTDAGKSPE